MLYVSCLPDQNTRSGQVSIRFSLFFLLGHIKVMPKVKYIYLG
jgi:hypothetical protein